MTAVRDRLAAARLEGERLAANRHPDIRVAERAGFSAFVVVICVVLAVIILAAASLYEAVTS